MSINMKNTDLTHNKHKEKGDYDGVCGGERPAVILFLTVW